MSIFSNNMKKEYRQALFLSAILLVALVVGANFMRVLEPITSKPKLADAKILIIYTGGTIGMIETSDGLKNVPNKGTEQLDKYLALYPDAREKVGEYDILSYDPLIDSSNMAPSDWNKMIKTIHDNYTKYDAFVIMHGTDTMAYTASALSFGLKGLDKPVVITGAQEPLAKLRNDGINNLVCSLVYASMPNPLSEVVLIFNNVVYRGNRTKKLSPNKNSAFGSPNFPPLGKFGINFEYNVVVDDTGNIPTTKYQKYWQYQSKYLDPDYYSEDLNIPVVFMTPGIDFAMQTQQVKTQKIDAIILLTFGIGNGPDGNKSFQTFLRACKERNIPVYNISQCCQGRVEQGDYATGSFLSTMGVVGGLDLTLEAAFTKACWAATQYPQDASSQKRAFAQDLVGELSPPGTERFEIFIEV